MIYALALLAPLGLLVLMLVMERVEEPLRHEAVGEQLVDFLDRARPDEVETFVSQGYGPALEHYWNRRRAARLRRRRTRHHAEPAATPARANESVTTAPAARAATSG